MPRRVHRPIPAVGVERGHYTAAKRQQAAHRRSFLQQLRQHHPRGVAQHLAAHLDDPWRGRPRLEPAKLRQDTTAKARRRPRPADPLVRPQLQGRSHQEQDHLDVRIHRVDAVVGVQLPACEHRVLPGEVIPLEVPLACDQAIVDVDVGKTGGLAIQGQKMTDRGIRKPGRGNKRLESELTQEPGQHGNGRRIDEQIDVDHAAQRRGQRIVVFPVTVEDIFFMQPPCQSDEDAQRGGWPMLLERPGLPRDPHPRSAGHGSAERFSHSAHDSTGVRTGRRASATSRSLTRRNASAACIPTAIPRCWAYTRSASGDRG